LAPQIPLLFQGEEWGARSPFLYFTDHVDPRLRQAVTEGRRREFPEIDVVADPQSPATYERSQLAWEELEKPPHAEMLSWYRGLIAIRTGLARRHCEVSFDEAAQWLRLARGDIVAVFNFASASQRIPLPSGRWQREMASANGVGQGDVVPPGATVIYRADPGA
jgi:maltooligosyltrehalose trehalohydrolase